MVWCSEFHHSNLPYAASSASLKMATSSHEPEHELNIRSGKKFRVGAKTSAAAGAAIGGGIGITTGAVVGSVVPGIGTAFGAVVGGVAGALVGVGTGATTGRSTGGGRCNCCWCCKKD